MSRKDYQAIADVLRNAYERQCDSVTLTYVAGQIGEVMQRDNARFDYARFMRAAGVPGFQTGKNAR
jgi:hypothetical protein